MLIFKYLVPVILLSVPVGIVLTEITLSGSYIVENISLADSVPTKDISSSDEVPDTTEQPFRTAIEIFSDENSVEIAVVEAINEALAKTSRKSSAPPAENTSTPVALHKAPPVKMTRKAVVTAKPPPTKKETRPPQKLTLANFLATNWSANGNLATLLPSSITKCLRKSSRVECWSQTHQLKLSDGDQRAKTRSLIQDFNSSGFTIKYKHMFLSSEQSTAKWDDATYQLNCTLKARNKIKCIDKNSNKQTIFTTN